MKFPSEIKEVGNIEMGREFQSLPEYLYLTGEVVFPGVDSVVACCGNCSR